MWEYFLAGGPLMWPLLACSVLALAVIIERGWFWQRLHPRADAGQAADILMAAGEGSPWEERPAGILAAMLLTGMAAPPGGCARAMEAFALETLARMRKGMGLLDTIITAAPMLGIMGTVLGIITSFDMLGLAGASEPKAVIAGIAQALITTVAGLGIAVITIFPYNYFNSRIMGAQELMEVYGTRLEIIRIARGELAGEKNASAKNA